MCFSFLATKDHFSSSCSRAVEGGKARQLVVELAGVAAGAVGQAADGVLADADQACGLADAAAVGEMAEDAEQFVLGQAGVEERGALAFGEAGLAGLAVQQAAGIAAVAHADGEVAGVAAAVVRAIGVLAAEAAEVIHGRRSKGGNISQVLPCWRAQQPKGFNTARTPPGKYRKGKLDRSDQEFL
jgi:hypothetical protein